MNPSSSLPELLGESGIYREMKRLARRQLMRQSSGATLNTTALVHEACLKLAGPRQQDPEEQAHWLNLAVMAMRQVLCDHARRRVHRQATLQAMSPEAMAQLPAPEQSALEEASRLLRIDALVSELRSTQPRRADVLTARFFGGLSEVETATATGLSLRTVQREWQLAKEWLRGKLERG